MKGRINKYGNLCIERAGIEKAQVCPFLDHDNIFDDRFYRCGDWCPLFGEPYPHTERANRTNGLDRRMVATGKTVLTLCQTALIFDEFTDEREETND